MVVINVHPASPAKQVRAPTETPTGRHSLKIPVGDADIAAPATEGAHDTPAHGEQPDTPQHDSSARKRNSFPGRLSPVPKPGAGGAGPLLSGREVVDNYVGGVPSPGGSQAGSHGRPSQQGLSGLSPIAHQNHSARADGNVGDAAAREAAASITAGMSGSLAEAHVAVKTGSVAGSCVNSARAEGTSSARLGLPQLSQRDRTGSALNSARMDVGTPGGAAHAAHCGVAGQFAVDVLEGAGVEMTGDEQVAARPSREEQLLQQRRSVGQRPDSVSQLNLHNLHERAVSSNSSGGVTGPVGATNSVAIDPFGRETPHGQPGESGRDSRRSSTRSQKIKGAEAQRLANAGVPDERGGRDTARPDTAQDDELNQTLESRISAMPGEDDGELKPRPASNNPEAVAKAQEMWAWLRKNIRALPHVFPPPHECPLTDGQIQEVLDEHVFFRQLAPFTRDLLMKNGCARQYKKGEKIFKKGEKAETVFLLLKGKVGLYSKKTASKSPFAEEEDSDDDCFEMQPLTSRNGADASRMDDSNLAEVLGLDPADVGSPGDGEDSAKPKKPKKNALASALGFLKSMNEIGRRVGKYGQKICELEGYRVFGESCLLSPGIPGHEFPEDKRLCTFLAEEDADVLVWHRQDFALDAQSLDAASLGLDSASHGGSDRFSVSASQGFGQNTAQTRKDSDQYNVKAIVQRPRVCLELHLPGMSSITRCGDGAHPGSAALMNAHMMTPERQNELAYVFNHTLYTKNMVVPDPGRLKVVMKGECALVYYYREGILPGTKPGQQGNAVSRAIKKRQHSRVVVARLAEGMLLHAGPTLFGAKGTDQYLDRVATFEIEVESATVELLELAHPEDLKRLPSYTVGELRKNYAAAAKLYGERLQKQLDFRAHGHVTKEATLLSERGLPCPSPTVAMSGGQFGVANDHFAAGGASQASSRTASHQASVSSQFSHSGSMRAAVPSNAGRIDLAAKGVHTQFSSAGFSKAGWGNKGQIGIPNSSDSIPSSKAASPVEPSPLSSTGSLASPLEGGFSASVNSQASDRAGALQMLGGRTNGNNNGSTQHLFSTRNPSTSGLSTRRQKMALSAAQSGSSTTQTPGMNASQLLRSQQDSQVRGLISGAHTASIHQSNLRAGTAAAASRPGTAGTAAVKSSYGAIQGPGMVPPGPHIRKVHSSWVNGASLRNMQRTGGGVGVDLLEGEAGEGEEI